MKISNESTRQVKDSHIIEETMKNPNIQSYTLKL